MFHTDGNLYVGDIGTGSIRRYDAMTGAPIDEFVQGADEGLGNIEDPQGFQFGPDGNLYVAAQRTNRVLRYNGNTGEFMDVFVPETLGVAMPSGLAFGSDGHLYAGFYGSNEIRRYDVTKDPAGALIDVFVPPGNGGLLMPVGVIFGPDGNLYVANAGTGEVLRYDGQTGFPMGAFVRAGTGGITGPRVIALKSKIKVCHQSPGNPDNSRTLEIGYLSIFDHLAHGDTLGVCQ